MEHIQEMRIELEKAGIKLSEEQLLKVAKIVLEAYQVEIFKQERNKVRAMRELCSNKAKTIIMDFHPFAGGRDQMIDLISSGIMDADIPNLTNTVKYMVAAE